MSPTSYQTALSRVIGAEDRNRTDTVFYHRRILSPVRLPVPPPRHLAPRVGLEPTAYRLTAECSTIELPRNIYIWQRLTLPQGLPCSTISALKLNLRVRHGNGCYLQAIITRC